MIWLQTQVFQSTHNFCYCATVLDWYARDDEAKSCKIREKDSFTKKMIEKNDGDCLRLMQISPRCVRVRSICYCHHPYATMTFFVYIKGL